MAKQRSASAMDLLNSMIPSDNPIDPITAGYNEDKLGLPTLIDQDLDMSQDLDADVAPLELGDRELGSHIIRSATLLLMEDLNIPDKVFADQAKVFAEQAKVFSDPSNTSQDPENTQQDTECTNVECPPTEDTDCPPTEDSPSTTIEVPCPPRVDNARKDRTLSNAIQALDENMNSLLLSLSTDLDDVKAYLHLEQNVEIPGDSPAIYLALVCTLVELCFRTEDTRLNLDVLEYLVCYKHNLKDIDYRGFKDALTKYTKALHSGTQIKVDKAKSRLVIYMSLKSL